MCLVGEKFFKGECLSIEAATLAHRFDIWNLLKDLSGFDAAIDLEVLDSATLLLHCINLGHKTSSKMGDQPKQKL